MSPLITIHRKNHWKIYISHLQLAALRKIALASRSKATHTSSPVANREARLMRTRPQDKKIKRRRKNDWAARASPNCSASAAKRMRALGNKSAARETEMSIKNDSAIHQRRQRVWHHHTEKRRERRSRRFGLFEKASHLQPTAHFGPAKHCVRAWVSSCASESSPTATKKPVYGPAPLQSAMEMYRSHEGMGFLADLAIFLGVRFQLFQIFENHKKQSRLSPISSRICDLK